MAAKRCPKRSVMPPCRTNRSFPKPRLICLRNCSPEKPRISGPRQKRRKPNVQIAPKLKCPSESSHLSELRPSVVRCIIEHVGEHYLSLGPYFPCDRRASGCPWFWRNRRSLHWNREGIFLHCSFDILLSALAGFFVFAYLWRF